MFITIISSKHRYYKLTIKKQQLNMNSKPNEVIRSTHHLPNAMIIIIYPF